MMWYSQKSVFNTREGYFSGQHKTFHQLSEDQENDELPKGCLETRKSALRYKAIPDAALLDEPGLVHRFPIKILRHVTNEDGLVRICRKEGLLGHWKFISNIIPRQRYSWWMVHNPTKRKVNHTLQVANNFKGAGAFTPSLPFQDKAQLYGNFLMEYDAEYLFDQYEEQFCNKWDITFRIMGTFVYNKEIMYSVLVHSTRFNDRFEHLPVLSKKTRDQRIEKSRSGKLFWTPESIIQRVVEPYSAWECLSFAFHLPGKYSVFKLGNVIDSFKVVHCERRRGGEDVSIEEALRSVLKRRDVKGTDLGSKLLDLVN